MRRKSSTTRKKPNLVDPNGLGAKYLIERGIDLDFARRNLIEETSAHADIVAERLGISAQTAHRKYRNVQRMLWFPVWVPVYHGGKETIWSARALPNGALKNSQGKEQRFVFPVGERGLIYIPEQARSAAKTSQPLVLTEGFFKGLALSHAGALPIALGGAWINKKLSDEEKAGWNNRTLREELEGFRWSGRTVYFAFDSDQSNNKSVRQAVIRAWILLTAQGAIVKVLVWPKEEGKGIDDYLGKTAGTDPAKQNQVLTQLFSDALDFQETLVSGPGGDAELVRAELRNCKMGPADRSAFAKAAAKKLAVAPATLLSQPEDGNKKDDRGQSVEIPPTAKAWELEVKAGEVLDDICATILRFVSMQSSQRRTVALWIVLTYLHDAVNILPIALITSPEEECGKSTLLELIYNLCNRPIPCSNISAAAIYRTIKDDCPTLILDEADTYLKEDEVIRGVLNSGHKRAFAYVIRVINDKGDTGRFSTWCPKAIAMIGLPKKTIISRSIHIRLDRKSKDTKTEKLKEEHYQEFEVLRRKISRLANDIRTRVKAFKETELLGNRAGDNWNPLFAIASLAGEEWLKKTVLGAQRMSQKDAHDTKSFGSYLLESLDRIIQVRRETLNQPAASLFLRTTDLLSPEKGLNGDKEAPWFMKSTDGLSANGLANALRAYEIKSEQTREGEARGRRGYWSEDIEKAVKKYVNSEK
jgi:putative DNA primase/helicase